MVKEKYLIVQCITKFRGNEIIERKIAPIEEYPYAIEKEEAIKILEDNPGVYLAIAVLIKE